MSSVADTDERLREIVELSRLYDTYGVLLNEHTRVIFESYILENYSLSEIADEQGMTRQGVRDLVVRGSKKLQEAEEKLGFLKKTDEVSERVRHLIRLLSEKSEIKDINDNKAVCDELKGILEILEA